MVVVLIITRPQSAVIPDHYITKVKALCLSHMLLHINVSLSPWWSLLTPLAVCQTRTWCQHSSVRTGNQSPLPGHCARLTTLRACTRPISGPPGLTCVVWGKDISECFRGQLIIIIAASLHNPTIKQNIRD